MMSSLFSEIGFEFSAKYGNIEALKLSSIEWILVSE